MVVINFWRRATNMATSTAVDPVQLFDSLIPRDFQRATLRCLLDTYTGVHDACGSLLNLPREEAHDVRPYLRRSKFDAEWRAVAARFPSLTATVEGNDAQNCHHTLISAGCVRLTASAVESDATVVRQAVFRKSLATSNQLYLFEDRPPPPEGALLYAILIHGPRADQRQPFFADIVFPTSDCDGYAEKRIRLFDKFSSMLAKATFNEERVEDTAQPTLRGNTEQKKSESV